MSDSPMDFTSVRWDRDASESSAQHGFDQSHGADPSDLLPPFAATEHDADQAAWTENNTPHEPGESAGGNLDLRLSDELPSSDQESELDASSRKQNSPPESIEAESDSRTPDPVRAEYDDEDAQKSNAQPHNTQTNSTQPNNPQPNHSQPESTSEPAEGPVGTAGKAELGGEGAVQAQIQALAAMEAAAAKYTVASQVSNPISDRDGNAKAFISYLVTTVTNHPDIKKLSGQAAEESVTLKVRRRYGDFRFLHDCLASDFPQALVPPLPPKSNIKYLTGDTFSTQFVHKRLHSLDRFVTFICQHKLLSQSSVFHYFVSDSAEWATFTKNLKISKTDDDSIVGKVVNEELMTETVMNFFTSSKHKRETNKDILEISDKLKKLYENLLKLDRIFSKLNKKNSDLKSDYESFSAQINKLALLHESATTTDAPADSNSSFVSSIESGLSNNTTNFKIFSEALSYFSQNWAELSQYVDESFLVSLRDCAKYIVKLTDLIELQHNKKIDLQVLQDYLKKARNDLASIGGGMADSHSVHSPPPNPTLLGHSNGGIVNNTTQLIKDTLSTSATAHIGSSQSENKKWKLRQRIAQLEGEIELQTQLVNNLTSRIINEEYPNWDRFNKVLLKRSMTELCDHEIDFYKGLVDNWTDVESKLLKRLDELA